MLENAVGREDLMLLGNPLGEELMLLNPPKRRRGRVRRRGRARMRVRILGMNEPEPARRRKRGRRRRGRDVAGRFLRRNDPEPRRRRRGGRRARRLARNPVGEGFSLRRIPGYLLSGALGAGAGALGYWGSKKILGPEHDQSILGYALHGGIGTVGAVVAGGFLGRFLGRGATAIMITGAWVTVFFRASLNHLFKGVVRGAGAAAGGAAGRPPTGGAAAGGGGGAAGLGEILDLGYDYSREELDGLAQAYQSAEPYDMGQAYQRPEAYDMGQVYQPARALPAASMPAPAMQEAPELRGGVDGVGVYSKRPVTWATPIW